MVLPLAVERILHRIEQTLGDVDRVTAARRRIEALAQDGELVTAEARDDVAGSQDAAQPVRERREQAVADFVAERVVDDLETVEVDEEDRERSV